jgi:hypothetical protein
MELTRLAISPRLTLRSVPIAQVVQADYLVLAEEPDTEASQAGQPNLNIPGDAAAMISGEIAAVQALNLPNIQLGAGVGACRTSRRTFRTTWRCR